MKKSFSIFWAFYLLLLACLPCQDAGLQCAEERMTTISADHFHASQSGEHEQDLCSPFCVCGCCSISSFAVKLSPFHLLPPSLQNFTVQNFAAVTFFPQDIAHGIFQPPRA